MQSPCNLHLAGRAVAAQKKKKKKSRQDPSGQWKQRTLVNDACAPPESIMLDAERGDKSPPLPISKRRRECKFSTFLSFLSP